MICEIIFSWHVPLLCLRPSIFDTNSNWLTSKKSIFGTKPDLNSRSIIFWNKQFAEMLGDSYFMINYTSKVQASMRGTFWSRSGRRQAKAQPNQRVLRTIELSKYENMAPGLRPRPGDVRSTLQFWGLGSSEFEVWWSMIKVHVRGSKVETPGSSFQTVDHKFYFGP